MKFHLLGSCDSALELFDSCGWLANLVITSNLEALALFMANRLKVTASCAIRLVILSSNHCFKGCSFDGNSGFCSFVELSSGSIASISTLPLQTV